MIKTHGYATHSATTALAPFDYEHREPGPKDVFIAIEFCGICHSDIHQARNEWGNAIYPMVLNDVNKRLTVGKSHIVRRMYDSV